MRFLCYGSGAVGSLIGGYLAIAGYDVSLVGRPRNVLAIMEHGLVVERPEGYSEAIKIPSYLSLQDAISGSGVPDMVILSVKSYDTESTIRELEALPDATRILTVQNGIGNEESLAEVFGGSRVISGALTLSVSMPEPRLVRQNTSRGGLAFAPVSGELPDLSAFAKAGFRVTATDDYRALKWSKLLLNMTANATCAILAMTPNEVFTNLELVRLEQEAMREASRVMASLGIKAINLPGFNVRLLRTVMTSCPAILAQRLIASRLGKARGDKPPSLFVDLLAGKRRSEVLYLNGAIEKAGREVGIRTPVNSTLSRILCSICDNPDQWDRYRRNPSGILAELGRAV